MPFKIQPMPQNCFRIIGGASTVKLFAPAPATILHLVLRARFCNTPLTCSGAPERCHSCLCNKPDGVAAAQTWTGSPLLIHARQSLMWLAAVQVLEILASHFAPNHTLPGNETLVLDAFALHQRVTAVFVSPAYCFGL